MITNTALPSGISVYWPLVLVGICGVVLVIIAILALLLIKGSDRLPTTWNLVHAILDKKDREGPGTPTKGEVCLRFFRIGRDGEVRKASVQPQKWVTVGSGEKSDICLAPSDPKLADKHFRISVNEEILLVSALESETFVNGVPITKLGTVQAYSGDMIRAGSHEYRVVFSTGEEKETAT